jgi:membrane associated rhomboid family serine protease
MGIQLTDVVKNLLIINVLVFFGTTTLMGDIERASLALFYFEGGYFRPWQIATHFFMHSDFNHLLFNMMTLVFLGPALESYLGAKKFLLYFFLTAMGASLLHTGVQYYELHSMGNPNILISSAWGASGAIYGVMVGFALKFPNTKLGLLFIPVRIPAKIFVLLIIAWDLFAGLGSLNTGIAHFAHLGGALAGFLIIRYWEKHSNRNRWGR